MLNKERRAIIRLDMYLDAPRYLGSWNEEQKQKAEKIRKLFPEIKASDNLDYVLVRFEAGYWRKANAIHNWFVENVQDGQDDCRDHYVTHEDLEKLKEVCKQILDNTEEAEELLPTQSGFFFGGTEYDDWYFGDLRRTIEICNYCLSLGDKYEFIYNSSW